MNPIELLHGRDIHSRCVHMLGFLNNARLEAVLNPRLGRSRNLSGTLELPNSRKIRRHV